MIITKSWLNEFIDISKISTKDICAKLNSIGLEVDSLRAINIPEGIIIGHIIECEKHPNADKLNVCKVDTGVRISQIVCGASNVEKGQYVAVATIGTKFNNELEIKPVKLRGIDSEGMICSAIELGLPELNNSILVLDFTIGELKIGKSLREYPILNDEIIEIELTANRGDCLSIYGVARELSTAFNLPLKEINFYEGEESGLGVGRVLHINHEGEMDASLLYKVINLKTLESSLKINLRLALVEEEDKNILNSILKYVTYTTGVVLRIYKHNLFLTKPDNERVDLKIKKDKLGFDTIYFQDKELSIVGVSQDESSKPTGIEEEKIIVEASYIDPEIIAKNIYKHKIKTDELYYRTSRGSEPNLENGINYLCFILKKYFNIEFFAGANELIKEKTEIVLSISASKIGNIIGQKIENAKVVSILKSLGFKVNVDLEDDNLIISVPDFRHDIKSGQDIVEEIVRIVGIDNIKSTPFTFKEANRFNSEYYEFKNKREIRLKSIANGFFEAITYVFSSKEALLKYGFESINEELELLNPIIHDLNTLRTTLLINLLKAVEENIKFGKKSVKLFEIGSVFNSKREESFKIAFIFSGFVEKELFSNAAKPKEIDFYTFADKISSIIGDFELKKMQNFENKLIHPYQSADIFINNKKVGFISKLHLDVAKELDLPDTFIAELDFKEINFNLKKAHEFSKFQASTRDLSLIVPKNLEFFKIRSEINSLNLELLKEVFPLDIYTSKELGENMSLTIRMILQSNSKTLEEEEINSLTQKVLTYLQTSLKIGLR